MVPVLRFKDEHGQDFPDWSTSLLGNRFSIKMCKRIFTDQTGHSGEIPFYTIGTLGSKADKFISRELFEEYRNKYNYPKKGETLITCSGTIGKTEQFDGIDAYYQDSNIVWMQNDEDFITNDFAYILISKNNWNRLSSTTITRLYTSDLKQIKLCYPVILEQQKIADFLSSVDTKIEQLTRKKELLEKYKTGMMQKLFPKPGEQHPELRFKDEYGQDFPDWEMKNILEFSSMKARIGWQNLRKEEHLESGDYYLVTGTEFENNEITWETSKYVEYERYIQDKNIILKEGDILITKDGSIGKLAFVRDIKDRKATLNNGIFRIRVNEQYPHFVFYTFESVNFMKFMHKLSGGSSIKHLYQKDFETYRVSLPSLVEQKMIATFLDQIDSKINTVISEFEKARTFKKGLLQQMFV